MRPIYLPLLVLTFLFSYNATAQVSWTKAGQTTNLPKHILDVYGDGQLIVAVGDYATAAGIARSTDGGATWSQTSYSGSDIYGVDRYGNLDNVICVGEKDANPPRIWRSYNAGTTWEVKNGTNINGERFFDVAMLDTNIAVVTASSGIYKTTDFAQTFVQKFTLTLGKLMTRIIRLANGNLLAGSETSTGQNNGWKIHLSVDQGESWIGVDSVTSGNYGCYGFVQMDNGTVYVQIWTSNGSFFRKSNDNGLTWSDVSAGNFAGGTKSGTPRFASYQNNLYAEEWGRGLSVSGNNGSTWQWNFRQINYVAKNGTSGLILFGGTGPTGTDDSVYVSANPNATANVSSIPLNTNISLGTIGTINFSSCSATSLRVDKYNIKYPLKPGADDCVNQHWMVLMKPVTSSYNGTITFAYDPSGIVNQGALQAMRIVQPKSSNGYKGAWVYFTTSIDSVNHTFTVSGITEFPIWLTLRKNGSTQGILGVPNTNINFGNVEIFHNRDTVQTYSNTGYGPITISAINISGANSGSFSIVTGNAPFTILPGATHDVTFRFASSLPTGAKNATATFVHNGQGGSNNVALTGTSTQAGITINPLNLNFGLVDTLATKVDSIRVTNNGLATLIVYIYTITGQNADQFSITKNAPPFTLQPGEFKQISIKFAPHAPNGLRTAQMNLTHNAPGSPSVVLLNGQAVPVELKSFTAEIAGEEIILHWVTESETNNAGFAIEQNINSTSWREIGFVNGAGTTHEKKYYEYHIRSTVGNYQFRLKQIDFDGTYGYSQVLDVNILPEKIMLYQNYPNPFGCTTLAGNSNTQIQFALSYDSYVTLKVYDIFSRVIGTLVNEEKRSGMYNVTFNASNLPNGIYFYKLEAKNFIQMRKMNVLK